MSLNDAAARHNRQLAQVRPIAAFSLLPPVQDYCWTHGPHFVSDNHLRFVRLGLLYIFLQFGIRLVTKQYLAKLPQTWVVDDVAAAHHQTDF